MSSNDGLNAPQDSQDPAGSFTHVVREAIDPGQLRAPQGWRSQRRQSNLEEKFDDVAGNVVTQTQTEESQGMTQEEDAEPPKKKRKKKFEYRHRKVLMPKYWYLDEKYRDEAL